MNRDERREHSWQQVADSQAAQDHPLRTTVSFAMQEYLRERDLVRNYSIRAYMAAGRKRTVPPPDIVAWLKRNDHFDPNARGSDVAGFFDLTPFFTPPAPNE
jgi:hypothetical protein